MVVILLLLLQLLTTTAIIIRVRNEWVCAHVCVYMPAMPDVRHTPKQWMQDQSIMTSRSLSDYLMLCDQLTMQEMRKSRRKRAK